MDSSIVYKKTVENVKKIIFLFVAKRYRQATVIIPKTLLEFSKAFWIFFALKQNLYY